MVRAFFPSIRRTPDSGSQAPESTIFEPLIPPMAGLDPGACPGLDPGFNGVTAKTQFFSHLLMEDTPNTTPQRPSARPWSARVLFPLLAPHERIMRARRTQRQLSLHPVDPQLICDPVYVNGCRTRCCGPMDRADFVERHRLFLLTKYRL